MTLKLNVTQEPSDVTYRLLAKSNIFDLSKADLWNSYSHTRF